MRTDTPPPAGHHCIASMGFVVLLAEVAAQRQQAAQQQKEQERAERQQLNKEKLELHRQAKVRGRPCLHCAGLVCGDQPCLRPMAPPLCSSAEGSLQGLDLGSLTHRKNCRFQVFSFSRTGGSVLGQGWGSFRKTVADFRSGFLCTGKSVQGQVLGLSRTERQFQVSGLCFSYALEDQCTSYALGLSCTERQLQVSCLWFLMHWRISAGPKLGL